MDLKKPRELALSDKRSALQEYGYRLLLDEDDLKKLRELSLSANGSADNALEYISRLRQNAMPSEANFARSQAQKFKGDMSLVGTGVVALGSLAAAVAVAPSLAVGGAAATVAMLGKTLYHKWKSGAELAGDGANAFAPDLIARDLKKAAGPWGRLVQAVRSITGNDLTGGADAQANRVYERAYQRG